MGSALPVQPWPGLLGGQKWDPKPYKAGFDTLARIILRNTTTEKQ